MNTEYGEEMQCLLKYIYSSASKKKNLFKVAPQTISYQILLAQWASFNYLLYYLVGGQLPWALGHWASEHEK